MPPSAPAAARCAGGVRTLVAVFVLIGAAFGAIEVAVPAAADAAGHRSSAGLLLGIWGLGSLLGGLIAAHSRPPADAVRRLCVLLILLAAGHALLALNPGLLVLGALLLLAGGAIAPSLGLAYRVVDSVAPAGAVTEAFTWLTTGIAAGFAAGSALGGVFAQGPGAGAAFVLAGTACAGAAAVAAVRRGTLSPAAAAAPAPAV